MRTKILATTALGVGLLAGSLTVAAVGPLSIAGAQTTDAPSAQAGAFGHRAGHRLARHEFKVAADTIGIPATELRDALKGGQSIAEVATEKGVPVDDVVNAVVADVSAKVDQAVANGRLTQEQGDKIKAKAPERVTKLVNAHKGDGKRDQAPAN